MPCLPVTNLKGFVSRSSLSSDILLVLMSLSIGLYEVFECLFDGCVSGAGALRLKLVYVDDLMPDLSAKI